MANACVFCGKDTEGLTDEHVWPDWLWGELGNDLLAEGTQQRILRSGETQAWSIRPFNAKVKIVCEGCNTGWMASLESHVKSLLINLMWGRQLRLTVRRQRWLALWVAKTAVVAQHLNPAERVVPAAHYIELYRTKQPPSGTAIFVGRSMPPGGNAKGDTVQFNGCFTSDASQHWPTDAPGSRQGDTIYVVSLRLGAFVAQVLHGMGEPPFDRSTVARIWPPTGRFDWPPPDWLSSDLRELHLRFWLPKGETLPPLSGPLA